MEPRIKNIIEDLVELKPLREDRIIIDMILDDKEKVVGISIQNLEEEKEELIWIETFDDDKNELNVRIHPEVEDRKGHTEDFWVVLYCISANLKREEADVWGNTSISEIAEELYDSRARGIDVTEELVEKMSNFGGFEEIPDGELPDELHFVVGMEELSELVLEYEEDDAVIVVDFINTLAEINGIDLKMGISKVNVETGEETEPEFFLGDKGKREVHEVIDGVVKGPSILDQNYVTGNLSTLMNFFLSEDNQDKDTLIFLNQLIYERIQIEKLLDLVALEEEEDDEDDED